MDKLLWLWITLGSIVLVGLIILVWYIITLNHFKKIQENTKTSMLDIDELIHHKYDLLVQIVELTKRQLTGYAKEIGLMREISKIATSDTVERKQDISNQVPQAMQGIYHKLDEQPTLKKSKEIKTILDEWIVMEESLQIARRVYNANVSNFNRKVVIFPFNLVAKINKYKRVDFFEADMVLTKDYVEHV